VKRTCINTDISDVPSKKSVSTHNGLVSDSFPEKKMKKVVFDTNRDNNKKF